MDKAVDTEGAFRPEGEEANTMAVARPETRGPSAAGTRGSGPVTGPRVILRPAVPEDDPWFLRWSEDATVRRHFLGSAQAGSMIPRLRGSTRQWVRVIATRGGRLLGWLELRDISWRRRSAELRVCLGEKDVWGRGYGTEAVRAALAHAFGQLGMREVYLRVAAWNLRAIRSYRKCGFAPEGRLPAGRRRAHGADDLILMTARAGD
jgi:RimJ/RimL family protein N-acetyltransferase